MYLHGMLGVDEMALMPCHAFFNSTLMTENYLASYFRECGCFFGVHSIYPPTVSDMHDDPSCGLEPGNLFGQGRLPLYNNHIEQAKEQITGAVTFAYSEAKWHNLYR